MSDVEKQDIKDAFERVLQDRLPFVLPDDREWILDFLAKAKGTIPYQKITQLNSLQSRPPLGEEFFNKDEIYSTLRQKAVDKQEYEDVKNFFKLLNLNTFGDLNKYYNIQNTLILCVIFERRSDMLQACSSLTLESAIAPVHFWVMLTGIRANAILCFL